MDKSFKIGKDFKPSPQFKKRYYIYLLLTVILIILPGYLIILIFAPFEITFVVTAIILAIILFLAYWVPEYYDSMTYRLNENEIVWHRGVWFKNTGIVPYSRITNVDITQGPISRRLGIADLRIQTAGYSGQPQAEIRIEGIENFEELRDLIMSFVKGRATVAEETYEKEDINLKILDELIKIRKLLEAQH